MKRKPGEVYVVPETLRGPWKPTPGHVTRVKQSFKDECDINKVIDRFLGTGQFPGAKQLTYADVSKIGDLQSSIELAREAEGLYAKMPKAVRDKYPDMRSIVAAKPDDVFALLRPPKAVAEVPPVPPTSS